MDSVMDAYWQAPPIARTLATAVVVISLASHISLLPAQWLIFHVFYIWKLPPEIWRFATSFLFTSGLGIVFDTYFLFMYLRELEVGNPRFPRKEDLVWYLIVVSLSVIGITEAMARAHITSGPYYFFLHGLTVAICYTSVQDMRGRQSSFYFFTVPSQLVPYCMIAASFLSPGGVAEIPLQIAGIMAGHLWDFMTRLWPEFGGGRNLLPTPSFLSRLVTTPRVLRRDYGTAFRQPGSDSGQSTGVSTGPLPDSWRSRGSGQRLGGE